MQDQKNLTGLVKKGAAYEQEKKINDRIIVQYDADMYGTD